MQSTVTRQPATPVGRKPGFKAIRVLVVDDHTVLRDTLRLLLEMNGEVEVVGEAADGRQAIDLAEQLKPDVILMDTAMPGLNGIEAKLNVCDQRLNRRVCRLHLRVRAQ